MQKQLTCELFGEKAMMALGRQMAPLIKIGDVVALSGGLGSGKTTLARGLIRALCGDDQEVPSPTFTLIQIYETPYKTPMPIMPIWHVDLYRLNNRAEIAELGLIDALDRAALIMEWPEKMGAALPKTRLDIKLTPMDDFRSRRAQIVAHGKIWERRLDEFKL